MATLFEVRVTTLVDGRGSNERANAAQQDFSSCYRTTGCLGPINYQARYLG